MSELSVQDKNVLSSIFSGTRSGTTPVVAVDSSLADDKHVSDKQALELTLLEKMAVMIEQSGNTQQSMEILNNIIKMQPLYASAYNNRAQLRRILREPLDLVLVDLFQAIELARPETDEPAISPMRAMVLRNAYDQLGAVYFEESNKPENSNEAWDLQMKASDYMLRASEYGESVAAQLAAHMNPYAKLCGSMMELCLGNVKQLGESGSITS